MSIHIALLRGINVGGHNALAMSDLLELFADLGFIDTESLLQSGNLVFRSNRRTGATLERLLEKETVERLGVAADYIIRSAEEWEQVVSRNPFPEQANNDPGHLVVVFLKMAPQAENVAALRTSIKGPETIHVDGKQLYVVYPAGIGRSKLSGTIIEKKLCSRGTARNWNTILKLHALCK